MEMDREQLLDELGRCFMRAAIDQLLRSQDFGAANLPGRQPEENAKKGETAGSGTPEVSGPHA